MYGNPCPANPRYNGHHACPQCGAPSFWRCFDADQPRIVVDCQNGCGTFETPYRDLLPSQFVEQPSTEKFYGVALK